MPVPDDLRAFELRRLQPDLAPRHRQADQPPRVGGSASAAPSQLAEGGADAGEGTTGTGQAGTGAGQGAAVLAAAQHLGLFAAVGLLVAGLPVGEVTRSREGVAAVLVVGPVRWSGQGGPSGRR